MTCKEAICIISKNATFTILLSNIYLVFSILHVYIDEVKSLNLF